MSTEKLLPSPLRTRTITRCFHLPLSVQLQVHKPKIPSLQWDHEIFALASALQQGLISLFFLSFLLNRKLDVDLRFFLFVFFFPPVPVLPYPTAVSIVTLACSFVSSCASHLLFQGINAPGGLCTQMRRTIRSSAAGAVRGPSWLCRHASPASAWETFCSKTSRSSGSPFALSERPAASGISSMAFRGAEARGMPSARRMAPCLHHVSPLPTPGWGVAPSDDLRWCVSVLGCCCRSLSGSIQLP